MKKQEYNAWNNAIQSNAFIFFLYEVLDNESVK